MTMRANEKVTWEEFVEIAIKYFNYLETEFGFRIVSKTSPFVRYESKFIKIHIYYEIDRRRELRGDLTDLIRIEEM
jgi:hypothetical protein